MQECSDEEVCYSVSKIYSYGRIKYEIGTKDATDDDKEEFDLEKVEIGENGANPNLDPETPPSDTPPSISFRNCCWIPSCSEKELPVFYYSDS